jgi:hypothetical protein
MTWAKYGRLPANCTVPSYFLFITATKRANTDKRVRYDYEDTCPVAKAATGKTTAEKHSHANEHNLQSAKRTKKSVDVVI